MMDQFSQGSDDLFEVLNIACHDPQEAPNMKLLGDDVATYIDLLPVQRPSVSLESVAGQNFMAELVTTAMTPPVTTAVPSPVTTIMASPAHSGLSADAAAAPRAQADGSMAQQRGKTSTGGPQRPKRQRPTRSRKPKLYEVSEALQDPLEEKRRLDAINAKKNRDRKKTELQLLDQRVANVTQERDKLLGEVEALRKREAELREELRQRFGVHTPL